MALTRADIEGALTCLNKAILQIVGNGEGLNIGLYTMHIDIKGSFPDANNLFDRSTNQLVVNIHANKQLKAVLDNLTVERVYISSNEAKITMVTDAISKTNDSILTAGQSSNGKEGLYAISLADGLESEFDTEISNMPSQLIYLAPS